MFNVICVTSYYYTFGISSTYTYVYIIHTHAYAYTHTHTHTHTYVVLQYNCSASFALVDEYNLQIATYKLHNRIVDVDIKSVLAYIALGEMELYTNIF